MFKYLSIPKVILILAVALMLALPATHIQPVQAAGTVITCSQAAFLTALSGGGTVSFGVDCSAVPIVLNTTITISSNTVINANGHRVTISGGNVTRIFTVSPGVTLELNGLQITNGAAGALSGGAVEIQSTITPALKGELIAKNTTFTNNTSLSGNGGAVFINGGKAIFENSTFSGNITYGTGNEGLGGAIYSVNGNLTIKNVTFSGNGARDGGGGGLHVRTQSGTSVTNVYNSIFAANQGGNCTVGGGAMITDGLGNLTYGDTACLPAANHSDPKLSSIGEYGSNMPLFALQTGSPAINLATANCPATDQRGVPRSTPACDSGAFEYRLPTTMAVTSETANPSTYGQIIVFQAAVTPSESTGLVEFYANGILIGSANLVSGTGTMATGVLRAGSYTITARYFGDSQYEVVDGSLADLQVVEKKPLTITADNKSRKYGTANPLLTWQAAGFANNESSAVFTNQPTCETTAVIDSPVSGNPYPITCSGGAAANYTFEYTPGELTIVPDVLTVTAQNSTRPYGEPNPTFEFAITGFRAGEDISIVNPLPSCTTTATSTSAVTSTYPITCSGGTAANYSFAYVAGQLAITPVELIVIPDAKSRPYGAENPPFTAQYTGFKNGETGSVITNQPTCTTTAVLTSPVSGSPYPITCSGAMAVNYTFSYPSTGQLTITKAMLTLTAQNKTRLYGGVNPELTYTISGLVGTDTVSASCSTDATTSSPVGSYPINCQGAESPNYNFTPVPGSLTVTKAALSVVVDDKVRGYGQPNPTFTFTISGYLNGEGPSVVTQQPICSTTAVSSSPVGSSHAITCAGAEAANYTFNYTPGTLAITDAALTVVVNNKTKTYGSENPTLTYTILGLSGGDTEETVFTSPISCTTEAVKTSPVRETAYWIKCLGGQPVNYTVNYLDGELTVTKAELTVTADPMLKPFLKPMPTLTYTITGYVNDEDSSVISGLPQLTTTATQTSPGGVYPIFTRIGTLAADNYTFKLVDGTLTVVQYINYLPVVTR